MDEQTKPSWTYRLRSFVMESVRVFRITKKPSGMEFKTIIKVSGLGIIIIGMLGFVVQMIKLIFF